MCQAFKVINEDKKINENGRKAVNMHLEIHILVLHKDNASLMKVKITELEITVFCRYLPKKCMYISVLEYEV